MVPIDDSEEITTRVLGAVARMKAINAIEEDKMVMQDWLLKPKSPLDGVLGHAVFSADAESAIDSAIASRAAPEKKICSLYPGSGEVDADVASRLNDVATLVSRAETMRAMQFKNDDIGLQHLMIKGDGSQAKGLFIQVSKQMLLDSGALSVKLVMRGWVVAATSAQTLGICSASSYRCSLGSVTPVSKQDALGAVVHSGPIGAHGAVPPPDSGNVEVFHVLVASVARQEVSYR